MASIKVLKDIPEHYIRAGDIFNSQGIDRGWAMIRSPKNRAIIRVQKGSYEIHEWD